MKATKAVTVKLANGKEITVDVDFTYGTEIYGADADGNRGMNQYYQEEDYNPPEVDNVGNPLTEEEKKECEELLEKKFETIEFNDYEIF